MDENQRELRRAQIAELQIALEAALKELDELDKRVAARPNVDAASSEQSNRLADQVALGMTKAGVLSHKP
ncbi:MAG: hypothetical protein Q7T86_19430 [Hyphomicrobiaceae bacterium]|nr:hypothetical protein [Hyphomicrobiaceae bacterium]